MAALTGVRAPDRPGAALHRAGGVALGCAAGLWGYLWLVGQGGIGYAGWPVVALLYPVLPVPVRRFAIGAAVILTTAAGTGAAPVTVALLGLVALVGPAGRAAYPAAAGLATLAASALIASYDNGWRAPGWDNLPRTTGLVLTLAIVPFAVAALAGVRALRAGPYRLPAIVALTVGTGWIAALTVPYLRAWGPILFLVPAAALAGTVLRTVRRFSRR
jgi:hypothetical protein